MQYKLLAVIFFVGFLFTALTVFAVSAPTASSVSITGSANVGLTLTGSYTYNDADADPEGVTTFRWLRAATSDGTYRAISGATSSTYVLTSSDANQYIKFEATPVSTIAPVAGTSVLSAATGPVYLLSDDFAGTVIDTTKWTEYDTDGTRVVQNENLSTMGTQYLTHMTRGISSVNSFDRAASDLNIEADVTMTDCTSRGGIYFSAWGGYPADSLSLIRNAGGWVLAKGPFTSTVAVTGVTCANNVAMHVKLVLKKDGGAEAYLNNAVTPGGTLSAVNAPNTINDKKINFSGTYDGVPMIADNFLVYNSLAVPGAPTSLSVTGQNGQAALSWTAPASVGSSAITDYLIEYKESSSSTWLTFNDGVSTGTTVTVTGLVNSTAYDFRVGTTNAFGTGDAATGSATPAATVTNQPTGLLATGSDAQLSLTWTAPSDIGGSAITDYVIEYKTGSDAYAEFPHAASVATTATITGLTNGYTYTVRVSAVNGQGTSTPSETTTGIPVSATPTAPQALSVVVSGSQTIGSTLTATYTYADANADAEGVSLYQWKRADASDGTYYDIQGANDLTYTLVSADMNTYVKFSVTPISGTAPVAGTAVLSSAVGMIGLLYDAFTGAVVDTNNWTEYDTDGTKVIQNGSVAISGVGDLNYFNRGLKSVSTFDRATNDLIFEADVTYSDCSGRGGIFYGPWTINNVVSDSFMLIRNVGSWQLWKGLSATVTMTGITCTNNVATHVKIVIKAVGGVDVYLNNAVTPTGSLTAVQAPYTITNLNYNLSYNMSASSLTVDNVIIRDSRSAPGASVASTTYPGNNQATIVWDAPVSTGSTAITDYIVEYKTSDALTWSVFADGVSTSTRATVTGLTNLLDYDFRVFAVNSIGTGYPSNTVAVTPDLAAPNPPTNLVAVQSEGQVSLSWTASENNGFAVTDYIIQYKKGSDAYATFADGVSTGTSGIVTGLTNGLEYSFKVFGVNAVGTSGASEVVLATPVLVAATAPTATSVAFSGTQTLYEALYGTYAYVDPNADTEGVSTFRWLRSDTSDGVYSAISGETDNMYILGPNDLGKYIKFEVTAVSQVAPLTGTPVLSSATGAIGAEMSYLNHIISTGQSLSVGLNGTPVLSSTQPYQNKMLSGSSLVSLVETSVETPSSGIGNTITSLVDGNDYQVIVTRHGVSATSYAGLKKGTAPYQNGMDQVTNAKAAAEALSMPYRVIGVTVIHGEGDSISGGSSSYAGWLQQWQIDYETDIKAITGQEGTIPLFTDQMSAQTGYNNATSLMPLAQLAASEDNPGKIYLVQPKYQYEYSDFVHLTNASYRQVGENFGKVIKKVMVDREAWKPLSPERIERSGNVIYAQFHVPVAPLAIDTTIVSPRSNYGFEYSDSTNSASISSVELVGTDTVKVTLNTTPTGTSQQLRYAYTGTPGSDPGAQEPGSAAGNLRDSDTTTSLSGNILYNWSVHFGKDITADAVAPAVSGVTPSVGSTTATFAWTTDELSSTIIDYGLTSAYGSATTESDVTTKVLSHSAALSDLLVCTTYHYRVRSKDFAQNAGVSSDATFTTSGCTGSASVSSQTAGPVTVADGGALSLLESSKGISVSFPAAFSGSNASVQIKKLDKTAVLAVTSVPSTYSAVGTYVYDMEALSSVSTKISAFDNAVTVSIDYNTSDITTIYEPGLKMYRWDGSAWSQLTGCTVDASANSVTCTTTAFSVFALFGRSALDVAEEEAATKIEAEYTVNSWNTLVTALALPEVTEEQIIAKTTAINAAIAGLVSDLTAPSVTKLGDNTSDIALAVGTTNLVFSEVLSAGSKTAVQNALTLGANGILTYSWSGATLIMSASAITTFVSDVSASVTDLADNTATNLLLVDSVTLEASQTKPSVSGDAVIDNTNSQLVVSDETLAVDLSITDGTTAPTIDFGNIVSGGVAITPAMEMTSDDATVSIPALTSITNTDVGWDGILNAQSNTTISLPVVSGERKTLGTAIEIGLTTTNLTFDKGVRMLFSGQSGKRVGHQRSGSAFTEITQTCNADNQSVGNALSAGGECKISVGDDLVVWTKHFTTFATYTVQVIEGGGGAGAAGGYVLPDVAPVIPAPIITTPIPIFPSIQDPAKVEDLLAFTHETSKPQDFAKYKLLVKSDADFFKVPLTEEQLISITNFVVYGASFETIKLGSGERRAVIRDYFETVGRSDVIWEDIQRMSTGEKLIHRNLAKEQAQVGSVLIHFKKIVGHTPNFLVRIEDIAWNTLMYRIRFPRDLVKEQCGIDHFYEHYNKIPSTPMEWSIVRAIGYVLQ